MRISLYSQTWHTVIAVVLQTELWNVLCSSINYDAICYVIFCTLLLPDHFRSRYSRHRFVFTYVHDMFRLHTCIENGLMTYDVKLSAWLRHNSRLSCNLPRLSCFPNRCSALPWRCPYACVAKQTRSQLSFALLTFKSSGLVHINR
jgi:hypothetical protein